MALVTAGMLATVVGCSSDGYDTGDGRYSYLRADFCMAHITGAKTVDYIVTDAGDSVRLSRLATASWLPAKDTLCRALAYYDKSSQEIFSLSQVLVAQPLAKMSLDSVATDPLTIESAWKGGGFLNIGIAVKSGSSDEMDARQAIGIMADSVYADGDTIRTVRLRLLHAQNGVPEYYTTKTYISMPIPAAWKHAILTVCAKGYSGEQLLTAK